MLKLVLLDNGVFDLAPEDPNATEEEAAQAAAETLVYAVLFTDQVAPEGRVSEAFDRRGWWRDETRGTGLWYVRRQALSDKARRESLNMVKRALEAKSEAITELVVTEVIDPRNVSSLMLEISGKHNGRQFIMRAPL